MLGAVFVVIIRELIHICDTVMKEDIVGRKITVSEMLV